MTIERVPIEHSLFKFFNSCNERDSENSSQENLFFIIKLDVFCGRIFLMNGKIVFTSDMQLILIWDVTDKSKEYEKIIVITLK